MHPTQNLVHYFQALAVRGELLVGESEGELDEQPAVLAVRDRPAQDPGV